MRRYKLTNDIYGERYREFILYNLKHSMYFSFTILQGVDKQDISFLKELNDKYVYKTVKSYLWYNHKVYLEPLEVVLYYSHPELIDFFVKNFDSLFPESLNGIEDLCFFDKERMIFGSVTHEKHAAIFPSDEIQLNNFMRFAEWEEKELTNKDLAFIPDFRKIL